MPEPLQRPPNPQSQRGRPTPAGTRVVRVERGGRDYDDEPRRRRRKGTPAGYSGLKVMAVLAFLLLFVVAGSLFLFGDELRSLIQRGPGAEPTQVSEAPTAEVVATAVPPTMVPTATTVPATATPMPPTATPEPTPDPVQVEAVELMRSVGISWKGILNIKKYTRGSEMERIHIITADIDQGQMDPSLNQFARGRNQPRVRFAFAFVEDVPNQNSCVSMSNPLYKQERVLQGMTEAQVNAFREQAQTRAQKQMASFSQLMSDFQVPQDEWPTANSGPTFCSAVTDPGGGVILGQVIFVIEDKDPSIPDSTTVSK